MKTAITSSRSQFSKVFRISSIDPSSSTDDPETTLQNFLWENPFFINQKKNDLWNPSYQSESLIVVSLSSSRPWNDNRVLSVSFSQFFLVSSAKLTEDWYSLSLKCRAWRTFKCFPKAYNQVLKNLRWVIKWDFREPQYLFSFLGILPNPGHFLMV